MLSFAHYAVCMGGPTCSLFVMPATHEMEPVAASKHFPSKDAQSPQCVYLFDQYACGTLLLRIISIRLQFDNRGTFNRGAAFERALWKRMGSVEVDDQIKGVDWLVHAGITDDKRVVLHGWSYGGYMTLMCLAKAPSVFAAGVAGAPVTSWQFYDTAYTERFVITAHSPSPAPLVRYDWHLVQVHEHARRECGRIRN
jgi:predicted acyl esterase